MKKIFFLAVVAVVFMACGGSGNGALLPDKDKKVLDKVTSESVALLLQNPTKVDQYLTDAGFEKIDYDFSSYIARRRIANQRQSKATSEDRDALYLYGISAKEAHYDDDEFFNQQNKVLEKGNSVIIAYCHFEEGQLEGIEISYLVPEKKGINKIYTDISEALYDKSVYWDGSVGKDKFKDHSEFVAAIIAAESVSAIEEGASTSNPSSPYVYSAGWTNPAEYREEGSVKCAEGYLVLMAMNLEE